MRLLLCLLFCGIENTAYERSYFCPGSRIEAKFKVSRGNRSSLARGRAGGQGSSPRGSNPRVYSGQSDRLAGSQAIRAVTRLGAGKTDRGCPWASLGLPGQLAGRPARPAIPAPPKFVGGLGIAPIERKVASLPREAWEKRRRRKVLRPCGQQESLPLVAQIYEPILICMRRLIYRRISPIRPARRPAASAVKCSRAYAFNCAKKAEKWLFLPIFSLKPRGQSW